jgi:hypothetical protein
MTTSQYDCIFSLGYRCSSAGLIKSLGLKLESYPFDWMVSRLPIIEDCIKTEFKYLLDPNHYECVESTTGNYTSLDPSSRQWICNESVCFNKYYESFDLSRITTDSQIELYLPRPITPLFLQNAVGVSPALRIHHPIPTLVPLSGIVPTRDAYGYKCMMNHRNIKRNTNDLEYFIRCVERWKNMITSTSRTLSIYIHPAIFYEEFVSIREDLLKEVRRFHMSFCDIVSTKLQGGLAEEGDTTTHRRDGIYIIPVKTPYDNPTNHCSKYVLEEQPDSETSPGCRICILWTNRDFVDAGEIFMGNCHVETYVVKDYLIQTIKGGIGTESN